MTCALVIAVCAGTQSYVGRVVPITTVVAAAPWTALLSVFAGKVADFIMLVASRREHVDQCVVHLQA